MQHSPQMLDRPAPWQAHDIDLGAIPMLLEFERNGVLIDVAKAKELGRYLDQTMEQAAEETQRLAGVRFNVSSDEEYSRILFDRLDLPVRGDGWELKKTKGSPGKPGRVSVGQDELAKIEHLHPCISTRKTFKEAQKLKGTYVEKIPRLVDSDNRLHSDFLLGRTTTGRLASKNPNIQNIPSRTEMGRRVKELFIARPGCVFVDLDYSQIELRCTAHISGDSNMINAYCSGDDLHWRTAETAYQKPRAELDKKEHRQPSKTTNFLTIYRGSAEALLTNLISDGADRDFWTAEKAQSILIDGFNRAYPMVSAMNDASDAMLTRYGFVWTLFGRIRRIEAVRSRHRHLREEAYRQGGNMRVQGTCADLVKIAMSEREVMGLVREVREAGAGCWPLLQVHDSLCFEVEKGGAVAAFIGEARERMTRFVEWLVPIETSGDVGESWGTVKALTGGN